MASRGLVEDVVSLDSAPLVLKPGGRTCLVTGSVQPKLGFGIGNRNQDQVSVSVSGPELFLPKPKLSR